MVCTRELKPDSGLTSPFLQAPLECGLTTGLAAASLVHTPMSRSRLPFPTFLLCGLIRLPRLPPRHRASLLAPQLPNRLPSLMFPSFLIPLPNRKQSRQAPRLSCRRQLMQMPREFPGLLIHGFSSIKYTMDPGRVFVLVSLGGVDMIMGNVDQFIEIKIM